MNEVKNTHKLVKIYKKLFFKEHTWPFVNYITRFWSILDPSLPCEILLNPTLYALI